MINNKPGGFQFMGRAAEQMLQKVASSIAPSINPNLASNINKAASRFFSPENLQNILPKIKTLVNNNPTLHNTMKDLKNHLLDLKKELLNSVSEGAGSFKAGGKSIALDILGFSLSQGIKTFKDFKNGNLNGSLSDILLSQGAKMASEFFNFMKTNGTTGAPPNQPNDNTGSNPLNDLKKNPLAAAAKLAATMAGFNSNELNDWMNSATQPKPDKPVDLHSKFRSSQKPPSQPPSEGKTTTQDLDGYKLLKDIIKAASGNSDGKAADSLISEIIDGLRPGSKKADEASTSQSSIDDTSNQSMDNKIRDKKIQENKIHSPTGETGIPQQTSSTSRVEQAKNDYFSALEQLIDHSAAALNKPAASQSNLNSPQADPQLLKDAMNLNMLWLPIQAANAIQAKHSDNGSGFIKPEDAQNIKLSMAALSTAILSLAGDPSKFDAGDMNIPTQQEAEDSTALFSQEEAPIEAPNTTVQGGVMIEEIEDNIANTSGNNDQPSLSELLEDVKSTFTDYMGETLKADNKMAEIDSLLANDEIEIDHEPSPEDIQDHVDLLDYLTSDKPEMDPTAMPDLDNDDSPFDEDQKAIVDAAIKSAMEHEQELLNTTNRIISSGIR